MDGSRVSDFSIERILSPQLGHKPPVMEFHPDGYLRGIPGGFSLDCGNLRPPAPLPAAGSAPGCLQHQGMDVGEVFYPCGAAFQRPDLGSIYPNPGVYVHFSGRDSADAQPLPGYHGYHHAGLSAQPQSQSQLQLQPQPQSQSRQKGRMRTVFTDSQTKRLEALFDFTDYPAVEARAELARSTGLSEETVRVWFKNRRARRKRQRSGSKVKSPSPPSPPYTGTDKRLFTSFL